jgi:hypothetical protein
MKRVVLLTSVVVFILYTLIMLAGCGNPGEAPAEGPGLSSASSLSFTDTDPDLGEIGGDIVIGRAAQEGGITGYRLYWTPDKTAESGTLLIEIPKTGGDIVFPLPRNSVSGTNYFLLCKTVNSADEEEEEGVSTEIKDFTNADLPTVTYEFYKPLEADENGMVNKIPIVFEVFETYVGSPGSCVHQVMLVFDPHTEQATGGLGNNGLGFIFYMPGGKSISIINPPINDGDPDYENDYDDDSGYYIVLQKVQGQTKWRLKIRYKPLDPNYERGVIGDINHKNSVDCFILMARNVILAEPEPGGRLSAVDVRIGSRTKAEYFEMADNGGDVPLGKTGVRFDPPPAVFVSAPFLAGKDEISLSIPAGAVVPYRTETFQAFTSNEKSGELSGGKWVYFSPDGSEDAQREGDIWKDRTFNLLGTHIMRYERHESLMGNITSTSYRYLWVSLNQE